MSGGEERQEPSAISDANPAHGSCGPKELLRVSRGFSCLFWGMPVLAAAHAAAWAVRLPAGWMAGLLLASFLPVLCGLGRLRMGGALTPRWAGRLGHALMLALVAMYLSPFLVWWTAAPMRGYFAANAAVHYVVLVGLMAGLNRLAGRRRAGWGTRRCGAKRGPGWGWCCG
jgi:hypothetical protein